MIKYLGEKDLGQVRVGSSWFLSYTCLFVEDFVFSLQKLPPKFFDLHGHRGHCVMVLWYTFE